MRLRSRNMWDLNQSAHRRALLAFAFGLALTACGDEAGDAVPQDAGGSHDSGAADGGGAPDAGGMVATATRASGSRLRAVFAESGAARSFVHYWDTQLNLPCRIGDPDPITGRVLCIPVEPGWVTLPGECSNPAGGVPNVATSTAPFDYVWDSRGRLARVGAPAPNASACPQVLGAGEIRQATLVDPATTLAGGTLSEVRVDARLTARIYRGDDGSVGVTELFDRVLGVPCVPTLTSGGGRCRPDPVAPSIARWHAQGCTRKVIEPSSLAGGTNGGFVKRFDASLGRWVAERLVPVPAGTVFEKRRANGYCRSIPSAQQPSGPLFFVETLSATVAAPITVVRSGARLAVERIDTPALAGFPRLDRLARLRDTQLNMPCRPVHMDGQPRCGPPLVVAASLYDDWQCLSQPFPGWVPALAFPYLGSQPIFGGYSAQGLRSSAALDTRNPSLVLPVYSRSIGGGRCRDLEDTGVTIPYHRGTPAPATIFADITLRRE